MNLFTQPEAFDHADWSKSNGTVTANASTAPDAATTADRLSDDVGGGTGGVYVQQVITPEDTTSHFISVYAKASASNWLAIRRGAVHTYFNLSSGAKGTTDQFDTSGIEALGGGWYRCWASFSGDVVSAAIRFYAAGSDGTSSAPRDGTTSIDLWGAHVENADALPTYLVVQGQLGKIWATGIWNTSIWNSAIWKQVGDEEEQAELRALVREMVRDVIREMIREIS